jgi:Zn-dependent protease
LLNLSPSALIQAVIIIVISLTVHEFAHSLAAIRLGDDTPRREGRLTLNPLQHVDLIGFIMLIIAGFGWAKPVRIDVSKLHKPRRDEILISLAGPASNLILAVLGVVLVWVVLATSALSSRRVLAAFGGFMTELAVINVSLAVFNMIPIPPLDGSHVLLPFLGKVNPALAATYFRYGSYVLLAVILFGFVTKVQILPIARLTYAIVSWMFGLVGIT